MVIISLFNIILRILLSYLLFSLVSSTLNTVLVRYRLVVISVLDGVLMGILDLLTLPLMGELLVLLAIVSSSVVVLYYPTKIKKVLLLELVLLAYVLLGWGVAYLAQIIFFNMFKVTATSYYIFVLIANLIVLFLGLIVYCFFRVSYKKKEILDFVFDVKISVNGRRTNLKMLLDSGNSLYDDNLTGLPVLIVSKQNLEQKLGLLLNLKKLRRISYITLNGYSAGLPVFEPDAIEVVSHGKNKRVKALIGVVETDFKLYDGLLHSCVC